MSKQKAKSITSHLSNKELNPDDACQGRQIRQGVLQLIRKDHPTFTDESYISTEELADYRKLYLRKLVSKESGDLDKLESDVLKSITNNKILSENIEETIDEQFTFGQRIADKIATFGGSWTFILTFFFLLLCWISINVVVLSSEPFDPYPFILLNLILSCLAAIQAPVIMMSQNRKEAKDRARNEHDYKINLKAELEIRLLHEKLDHLMIHQNKKLLEIQELQSDYLEEISNQLNASQKSATKL
jgi:uncharacterized membrane protein